MAESTAELRRSNELLSANEARFRALSENASDLVAILRPDGQFSYASPSHRRILGYWPDDLADRPIYDIVHPDDQAVVHALVTGVTSAIATDSVTATELRVRHADSTWLTLEVSLRNCLHDAAVRGLILNAHDVTLRKQGETERGRLLQAEQAARALAEEAVRVRDEFLTAAAHDLRTPLTVIMGQVEMMRMEASSGRDLGVEWLQRRLGAAVQACARMLAAIEEITDAAQLQMGRTLPLHSQVVSLDAIVRSVAASLKAGGSPNAAPVIVTAAGDIMVTGDPLRLERVFENILDNAIKYSPAGTPIHVEVAQEAGTAVVAVRDSGVGILADELPHIFTRFYRASTSKGIPGMGIGLAGAQAIVQQHKGQIKIDSRVGHGTTVTVTLPLSRSGHEGSLAT